MVDCPVQFAIPADVERAAFTLSAKLDLNFLALGSINQRVAEVFREFVPGFLQICAIIIGDPFDIIDPIGAAGLAQIAKQAELRRIVHERAMGLGDNKGGVNLQLESKPIARQAHAEDGVRIEDMRFQFW